MMSRKFVLGLMFTAWLVMSLVLSSCSRATSAAQPVASTSTPTIEIPAEVLIQIASTQPEATASPTAYFTPTPAPIPPSPTPAWASFCTPLKDHTWEVLQSIVSTPFDQPAPGKDNGHQGVDFAYYRLGERGSIAGTVIQSVLPGRVSGRTLNQIPYGNMLIIETEYRLLPPGLVHLLNIADGQSVYLLYAHMQDIPFVEKGGEVACGQALGLVGSTPNGWSSNPHLHLEVRVGPPGFRFDNMVFYDTAATVEEMDIYKRWRMSGDFQLYDPLILLKYGLEKK